MKNEIKITISKIKKGEDLYYRIDHNVEELIKYDVQCHKDFPITYHPELLESSIKARMTFILSKSVELLQPEKRDLIKVKFIFNEEDKTSAIIRIGTSHQSKRTIFDNYKTLKSPCYMGTEQRVRFMKLNQDEKDFINNIIEKLN